jgi:hypothetical protein
MFPIDHQAVTDLIMEILYGSRTSDHEVSGEADG